MVYPRKYPVAGVEPHVDENDWNAMVDFFTGFSATGTFKSSYSFVISTVNAGGVDYYGASNAYQTLYGGFTLANHHIGGIDGADANAVIQAAIGGIISGGVIQINAGTYDHVHVTVTDKNIIFIGEGPATIIKPPQDSYAFTFTSAAGMQFPCGVHNLKIDGTAHTNTRGIYVYNVEHTTFSELEVLVTRYGFFFGGNVANAAGHPSLTNINIVISDATGVGVLVAPTGVVLASVSCRSVYINGGNTGGWGFKFLYGANGPSLVQCGVAGMIEAGFYFAGSYSGGSLVDCFADAMLLGTGYYFTDTADALGYIHGFTLQNCWAGTCLRGIYIIGSTAANGVFDMSIQGYFFLSQGVGIRIEGYVYDIRIHDSIIRDNDGANVATDEKTNILIIDGPQFIFIDDCSVGWYLTAPAGRGYAMRLVNSATAPRSMLAFLRKNWIYDVNTTSNGHVGQKNEHAGFTIESYVNENTCYAENPTADTMRTEAGNTGLNYMHDFAGWLVPYASEPAVASAIYEGMQIYVRAGGAADSYLKMCMRKDDGSYEWKTIATST
jgi:hypothetical protein